MHRTLREHLLCTKYRLYGIFTAIAVGMFVVHCELRLKARVVLTLYYIYFILYYLYFILYYLYLQLTYLSGSNEFLIIKYLRALEIF